MKGPIRLDKKVAAMKPAPKSSDEDLKDYYAKERPSPSEQEQAEGDLDIVEEAIKNLERKSRVKAA